MSIQTDPFAREPLDKILESKAAIENINYIKDLLSSLSSIICIINDNNQVVFSNDVIITKFGLNIETDILGLRPGEVFNCVNATNDTGGCGTTEKCKFCGSNQAITKCWADGEKTANECRIIKNDGLHTSQLDLEIMATPFFHKENYIILSMTDITEKKRKELLEKIFFHDIINIAGSLSGVLQLFPHLTEPEKEEYMQIASSLSNQIIDEIKDQQQMTKAERGELAVTSEPVYLDAFLKKIADQIRFNSVAIDKKIEVNDLTDNFCIKTDEILLTRVLINMAKNALEAISPGEGIRITALKTDQNIKIEVFNNTYIKKEVQLQLFQRSYSTKGKDRGVGTYSMKLIGERYLKGIIDFVSTESEGTTFFIQIPIEI